MNNQAPNRIEKPIVIVHETGGVMETMLGDPGEGGNNYKAFGIIICDVIRHVARACNVSEDDVFKWVKREYRRPTTTIRRPPSH